MISNKPCKLCDKKRFANISWCYSHHLERERKKKEEKEAKKKKRKESTKKFKESIRKKLMKQAWSLMSEWVRRKEKGICYTCKKIEDWKNTNAGHRHHGKLNFDKRNIHCQCVYCNKYLDGNLGIYERNLIEEYGIKWSKQLEKDAWAKGNNYSTEELGIIIKDLTEKLKKYD